MSALHTAPFPERQISGDEYVDRGLPQRGPSSRSKPVCPMKAFSAGLFFQTPSDILALVIRLFVEYHRLNKPPDKSEAPSIEEWNLRRNMASATTSPG